MLQYAHAAPCCPWTLTDHGSLTTLSRPSLDSLERLATAVGQQLVVGVGASLTENRSIAKLVREEHAVVRAAS